MVNLQDFLSGFDIAGATDGILLNNEEDMRGFADFLSQFAKPGTVIALYGDLGVGKTTFSRYFAEKLGVTEKVSSPTFTILHEYRSGNLPLFHFDLYRVLDLDEICEFADEYFYGDGVCLIEWAENAHDLIPEDAIRLKLSYGDDENERIVIFASADENESGAEEYEFQDEGMQELYEVFGEDFSI